MTITHTFPADFKVPALRGVTVSGGVPIKIKGQDAVRFATRVQDREVIAMVGSNQYLATAVAEYRKAEEAKLAAYLESPRGQREALVMAERGSYSPDAFPGSRQWLANKRAADALAEFDAAHPELVAELKAEADAAKQAAYDNLSDFVKRGS